MTEKHANPPPVDPRDQKASPSGATDQTRERIKKFDDEGGDQPQAPTQQAVEEELRRAREEAP